MRFPQQVNRDLCAVLVIASLVFGAGFTWGLPEGVSEETVQPWGIDTVAPIMPLTEAYYKFTREGNEWVTYPLFHFIVLDGIYAPYIAFQYLKGDFESPTSDFPYGLKDPASFCRDLTLLARLVSLMMALGVVILAYKTSEELFSKSAAFWAALMTSLLAPLAYYAKTSNLDVPYVFWSCLAFWQYVKVVKYQRLRHYVLFAVSGALAIATKDQAYGFFLLIPVAMIVALAYHRSGGQDVLKNLGRACISRPILLAGGVTALVYAGANNIFFGGWNGFIRHVQFGQNLYEAQGILQGVSKEQIHSLGDQMDLLFTSTSLLTQTLGLGSLLLCVIGIGYAASRRKWLALSILIFPVSYYVFCIAVFSAVFVRYLLAPAVVLTSFGGLLIAELVKKKGLAGIFTKIAVAVCLLWQAALTLNLNLTLIWDSRYEAESWVKANIPKGVTIESQVRRRHLPYIVEDYEVTVVGQTLGTKLGAQMIPTELTGKALQERGPEYILLLGGLGISGDPENVTNPDLTQYYDNLLTGKAGYRVVAEFETPSFLPFRQITGTKPKTILLAKSSLADRFSQVTN